MKEPQVELYLSADERRLVLRQYGKDHGLRILIETGTNDGATPQFLKDDFDHIYTIELGRDQYRAAVNKFSRTNVYPFHGDSAEVLPDILRRIDEPALIWLDGHYSGPGTALGSQSTPVREELQALFNDGRPHVILVDDARIFDGGPEHNLYDHYATYPSLEWVEEVARGHGYDYVLLDDIIRLTPCV